MANGPYGPQTGGAPSPGPYNQRGGKKVGPYNRPDTRVQKMRDTLRKNGFEVDETGPMTRRMLTAWTAYRTGVGSAHWNAAHGKQRGPGLSKADVTATRAGVATAARAVLGVTGARRAGGGGLDNLPSKAAKTTHTHIKAKDAANKLGGKGGNPNPGVKVPGIKLPSVGKTDVNVIPDTNQLAGKIAGEEYDPQIREAQIAQLTGKRDAAQRQRDIGSWYGQVRGAQNTAAQRDTAAAGDARTSVTNALQGVLASLGGSRGAGVVGAQGLSDLTSLAAQGASQERYNADLAPLLASEEAGQHSRQAALASEQQAQLANKVIDLRGAKGQALAKALVSILPLANQARQQNFSNRLAAQNASLAGQALGVNTALNVAKVNLARTQGNRQYKLERAKLGLAGGSNKPPVWANLNALDRQKVINNAVAQAASEIPVEKGNDHWDATHVMNSALTILRSGGLTSARLPQYKGGGVIKHNQVQILGAVNRGIAAARQHYNSIAGLPPTTT